MSNAVNYAPKHPLPWKLYSGFVIAMMLLSILADDISFKNIFGTVVSIGLTFPLVGYAWQRRIVPVWLGVLAFWLTIVGLLFVVYFAFSKQGLESAVFFFTLLCFIPYGYATFVFAYRSPHLDPTTEANGTP